jgi:hypothetical protein
VKRLLLVLVGVGVAALGVGIWTLKTQVLGGHVTACGVDAQGPYAQVRVTSVKGALGSTRQRTLRVRFAYDHHVYDPGQVTTIILGGFDTYGRVHGRYPPRHLGGNGEVTVPGRTVYRTPGLVLLKHDRQGYASEYGPGRLVPRARVERVERTHPRWGAAQASQEVVPDDLSKIQCIFTSSSEVPTD